MNGQLVSISISDTSLILHITGQEGKQQLLAIYGP